MAEKRRARRGNPTKYDPDIHPVLVRSLARTGFTVEEIAEKLQVSKSTLYEWRRRHPDLSDALKEGRDFAAGLVEDALYKSALGFKRKTIRRVKMADGSTRVEETVE